MPKAKGCELDLFTFNLLHVVFGVLKVNYARFSYYHYCSCPCI